MAPKETLIKNLDWITEKISNQVWTLNLGTLGTTWSLLIATSAPNTIHFTLSNALPIMILCLISLICEMAQYLSAYLMDRSILKTIEALGRDEFRYDTDSLLYRLRLIFFWSKIALTILSALILIFMLAIKFS
jgi:hypothetical protein